MTRERDEVVALTETVRAELYTDHGANHTVVSNSGAPRSDERGKGGPECHSDSRGPQNGSNGLTDDEREALADWWESGEDYGEVWGLGTLLPVVEHIKGAAAREALERIAALADEWDGLAADTAWDAAYRRTWRANAIQLRAALTAEPVPTPAVTDAAGVSDSEERDG